MSDVLEMIEKLRESLSKKYGNVLARKYDQNEIHMTYYAGWVLKENELGHREDYSYSEKAVQAAFIAGMRVGKIDTQQSNAEITNTIIDELADKLEEWKI